MAEFEQEQVNLTVSAGSKGNYVLYGPPNGRDGRSVPSLVTGRIFFSMDITDKLQGDGTSHYQRGKVFAVAPMIDWKIDF